MSGRGLPAAVLPPMPVSPTQCSEHDQRGMDDSPLGQRAGGWRLEEHLVLRRIRGRSLQRVQRETGESVEACREAMAQTASARASCPEWPNDEAALVGCMIA